MPPDWAIPGPPPDRSLVSDLGRSTGTVPPLDSVPALKCFFVDAGDALFVVLLWCFLVLVALEWKWLQPCDATHCRVFAAMLSGALCKCYGGLLLRITCLSSHGSCKQKEAAHCRQHLKVTCVLLPSSSSSPVVPGERLLASWLLVPPSALGWQFCVAGTTLGTQSLGCNCTSR